MNYRTICFACVSAPVGRPLSNLRLRTLEGRTVRVLDPVVKRTLAGR